MQRFAVKRYLRFVRSIVEYVASRLRGNFVFGLETGRDVQIGSGVRWRLTDEGKCKLGDNVVIERNSEITVTGGVVEIGRNTFIGQGSIIVSKDGIVIAEDCLIAEYVTIRDQNHKLINNVLTRVSGFTAKKINIGRNVWLGAKCSILCGVAIGDNSVVGAGSVVTCDVPADTVVAGVPAKIIRRRQ